MLSLNHLNGISSLYLKMLQEVVKVLVFIVFCCCCCSFLSAELVVQEDCLQ